ncbi:MAG: PilN domain-containing protein [Gammaproteobacteria bacterium]|nr:PilN domain-containing protein [Gammaproteobacteria bacterium]MDH3536692.1 PilN domain-containing protein [Gammaproteobacteria bacterium]
MKDYRRHPLLTRHHATEYTERRTRRKYLVVIPAVLLVAVGGLQLAWFLSDFEQAPQQLATSPPAQPEAGPPRAVTIDELLDQALRSERNGDRQMAHLTFQELLRQVVADGIHCKRPAAVFPRAASFYRKRDVLPPAEVENLYRQALAAITQVHDENYYDLENIHRGLEGFYRSQNRYDEAVVQTRLLLDFYRRYYPDEGTRYGFVTPTTVRLGQNLMLAGRITEAREAYLAAIALKRSRGQPTSAIEAMVAATYQPAAPASSMTNNRVFPKDPGLTNQAGSNPAASSGPSGNLKAKLEALQLDGVTVEQINEDDSRFTIVGFAKDNVRIAACMRLLDKEVGKPALNLVQKGHRQEKSVSEFSIAMKK